MLANPVNTGTSSTATTIARYYQRAKSTATSASTSILGTTKQAVSQAYTKGMPYLRGGTNFVYGIFNVIVGAVMGIASAIGATVAPDKSAFDILSKVGIVGALFFLVNGVWKLSRKETIEKEKLVFSPFLVSDKLGKSATKALEKVKELDNAYQSDLSFPEQADQSKIYSLNMDNAQSLRARAYELFKGYKDAVIDDLKANVQKLDKSQGPVDFTITRLRDEPISLSNLQLENALLLGYLVSSRQGRFKDDAICKQLRSVLGDSKVEEDSESVVSDHFKLVYEAARFYEENHVRDNKSINQLFAFPKDLASVKTISDLEKALTKEGPKKNKLKEYLKNIEIHHGHLKVLQQAIKYAKDNRHTAKGREISSALICGFGFKGNSDEVNARLEQVLNGVENGETLDGLKEKMTKFNEKFTDIDRVLRSENCPFLRESLDGDDVFPPGLNLFALN